MSLEFGIPSKRVKKVDEFEGRSVLVMHPQPTEKGKSTRFELSNQAATEMGYTEGGDIVNAYDPTSGQVYLANVTPGTPAALSVTKLNAFSNAKLFNHFAETFNVDPSRRNLFSLEIAPKPEAQHINSLMVVTPINELMDNASFDNNELEEEVTIEMNEHSTSIVAEALEPEEEKVEEPISDNRDPLA